MFDRSGEYRRDLQTLTAAERRIVKGLKACFGKTVRSLKSVQASYLKQFHQSKKQLEAIKRRRSILRGRLS